MYILEAFIDVLAVMLVGYWQSNISLAWISSELFDFLNLENAWFILSQQTWKGFIWNFTRNRLRPITLVRMYWIGPLYEVLDKRSYFLIEALFLTIDSAWPLFYYQALVIAEHTVPVTVLVSCTWFVCSGYLQILCWVSEKKFFKVIIAT